MAPVNSAVEARVTIAEERIERAEQQMLATSKELAGQVAYQKALFRQLEKIEDGTKSQIESLGEHLVQSLGGKLDDVKSETAEISLAVKGLAEQAAAHDKRIATLEESRAQRNKIVEWAAGIAATIVATGLIAAAGWFLALK